MSIAAHFKPTKQLPNWVKQIIIFQLYITHLRQLKKEKQEGPFYLKMLYVFCHKWNSFTNFQICKLCLKCLNIYLSANTQEVWNWI